MSNLINPKPRFGYNPTTGLLYDYVAQKDVSPVEKPYDAVDGTWNLVKVRDAILAGQTIEGGHLSVKKPSPPATGTPPNPAKPVAVPGTVVAPSTLQGEPNQPTSSGTVPAPTGTPLQPPTALSGLSAEQVTALKLSVLQMAALGIKPTNLTATGVSPTQVTSWALTPARADALKLTAEQRAVLMP